MRAGEAVAALAQHHDGELVVTGLGAAMHEWHRVHGAADPSFHMHTMGLASSFGVGLAIAQPRHGVWALEGDGGLVLNLGALLTLAAQQPANLKYFLICNRRYGVIDGPAWVDAEQVDFCALAAGAGIARAHHIGDVDELGSLGDICSRPGFDFLVFEVEPTGDGLAHADYEGPEIKYRFARHVTAVTGSPVLGPKGY